MNMDPVGTVLGNAMGMKRKFAFFICAGFSMIAAGMGGDGPPLPKRSVDHRAPLGFVTCLAHGRVRVLHDGEDAGRVGYVRLPLIGFMRGEMAGQPFDKGALFHSRGTPAHRLPFRQFRDASAAL